MEAYGIVTRLAVISVVRSPSISGPPDFVGVGAQRSGTTWWFEILLGHPQVRGPKSGTKEQHFFDRYCRRPMTTEDVSRYHRKFPRRDGQVSGEWTPRYMLDFWTPPLIARAAPEAKLLVLLRDPIERFRSGVPHRLSRTDDPRIEPAVADAIERGRYGTQMHRLRASFAAEQILVLQYEKCRDDPASEYRRTLEFLGVDPDHQPDGGFEQPRGTTQETRKSLVWKDMHEALHATYDPEIAELAELVPELDLSVWPNFTDVAADAVAR
jgi:hypothetical protein